MTPIYWFGIVFLAIAFGIWFGYNIASFFNANKEKAK